MKRYVADRMALLKHSAKERDRTKRALLLARWMEDPSPSIRSSAIQLAAESNDIAAVTNVEGLLHDPSEKVRVTALEYLGALGKGHGHLVRALLTDRSILVRIEALETLSSLKDRTALPAIAKLLDDENPLVRAFAARAIAALRGRKYVSAIQNAMAIEKQDSARAGFLEALIHFGKWKLLEEFLQLLSSADYRVRCSVANALDSIPLNRIRMDSVVNALSRAKCASIGPADADCVARALTILRRKAKQ